MRMSSWTRAVVLSGIFGSVPRAHEAQTPARDCVAGTLSIIRYAPASTAAEALLQELLWQGGREDYARARLTRGAAAGLDLIAERAEALLVVTATDSLHPVEAKAFRQELALVRAAPELAGSNPTSLRSYAKFAPATGDEAGQVAFLETLTLRFDSARPEAGIALCAAARTVRRYMELLAQPRLREVAEKYATAVERWDLYIDRGYSMTFIERLGHSCRGLQYLVAQTAIRSCRRKGVEPLGPPTLRTVFAHPSGGLAIYRDDSTNFPALSVVEWYGILAHRFVRKRLDTYGLSVASFYPQLGQPRLGLLLHTPLGKIGAYDFKDFDLQAKPHIVLSADIVGWIPGIRSSVRSVARDWVTSALPTARP